MKRRQTPPALVLKETCWTVLEVTHSHRILENLPCKIKIDKESELLKVDEFESLELFIRREGGRDCCVEIEIERQLRTLAAV